MSIIPELYIDILQSTAVAHVATIGPKGEPQSSTIWFGWDGTSIFFSLKKERQKYRNLLREPRIALSITDPTNPYRSIEIRGIVARMHEDLNYQAANWLSQKYLKRDATPDEAGPADERVVIYVEPKHTVVFPPLQEDKK